MNHDSSFQLADNGYEIKMQSCFYGVLCVYAYLKFQNVIESLLTQQWKFGTQVQNLNPKNQMLWVYLRGSEAW